MAAGAEPRLAPAPRTMAEYRQIVDELRRVQERVRELQRLLAEKEGTPAERPDEQRTVLACAVEDSSVAFDLSHVEEVLPSCTLTPFPQAPAWHLGMLSLHGEVVPILDVACRLGRISRRMALSDCIVIARTHNHSVGLLVQGVNDIVELLPENLEDVAVDVPEAPYVLGTFRHRDRTAFLIDLPALVTTSQLIETNDAR